ncbi:MAG TPA: hypothetical protein VJU61_21180 [Polyangiaceae bacterium]|nr:hypothetical protein [Polyangiaceae bacterium]
MVDHWPSRDARCCSARPAAPLEVPGVGWHIDCDGLRSAANGRAEAAWDAIYAGFESSDTYAPAPADYDGDGRADLASVMEQGPWLIDYAANGFGAWDADVSWGPDSFGAEDQCITNDQRICLPLLGCIGECTVTCCHCSGDHCTCPTSPCE